MELWWDVNQINATVRSKVARDHTTYPVEHIKNGWAAGPAELAVAVHRTDYRDTLSIIASIYWLLTLKKVS